MTAASLLTGAGNESLKPYLESSFGQTIVFDKPSNLAAGQRMIAVVGFQNNSLGNSTTLTPPGTGVAWTRLGPVYTQTGDSGRRISGIYISDVVTSPGSEPSTYPFTTNAPSSRRVGALRIASNVHPNYPDAISSAWTGSSASTSQDRTLTTYSTALDDILNLAYIHWQTNSSTPRSTTWTNGTEISDQATISTGTATHSVLTEATTLKATAGAVTAPMATLSGTSTVANGAGYMVGLRPADKYTVTTEVIAHRGIATLEHGAANQGATEEESIAGLTTLMSDNPLVNGVEIDARLPSDWASTGKVVLCHDTTVNRTSPNASTGTVSSMTTAQLVTAQMTFLDAYLAHIAANVTTLTTIMVQHYTNASTSELTPIVNVLNAQPAWLKARILVMTDNSNFAMDEIRAAGWTGRIGSYGMSAANWATYEPEFAANNAEVGFTDPGDAAYVTNRAHIATMISDGYASGGSTISNVDTMDLCVADGCSLILTDDPRRALSLYTTPLAGPLMLTASETISGADAISAQAVALTATETASGADTPGAQGRTAADLLAASEVAVLATAVVATEAGALADAVTATSASMTTTEAAAFLDAVTALGLTASEAASAADAVSALALVAADSLAAVEVVSSRALTAVETLVGSDNASTGGAGSPSVTETATAADNATLTVSLSAADVGSADDTLGAFARLVADPITALDVAADQARAAAETGTLLDALAEQARTATEAIAALDVLTTQARAAAETATGADLVTAMSRLVVDLGALVDAAHSSGQIAARILGRASLGRGNTPGSTARVE